jgi:hypothetical protein
MLENRLASENVADREKNVEYVLYRRFKQNIGMLANLAKTAANQTT